MTRLDHESRVHVSGIAHHLYWAGRLADPRPNRSRPDRGGDAAHAMYASEDAVQHYRRALEVLQETNGEPSGGLPCRNGSPTCWRAWAIAAQRWSTTPP